MTNRNETMTIIGAGRAGPGMSRCLTERSVDPVLHDFGETAQPGRTQRWDSLPPLMPYWVSNFIQSARFELVGNWRLERLEL